MALHPTKIQLTFPFIFLVHFPKEKNRNDSQILHSTILEHNHNLRASMKNVIGPASREVFSCSTDNYVFGRAIIDAN